MAAVGEFPVWAMALKHSGIFSMRSPWLIQTVALPASPMPANRPSFLWMFRSALPYSRLVDFATWPPRIWVRSCMP